MKNVEHPWVSIDIYVVEFTGKINSGIIVTLLSMALYPYKSMA
jgi:hypothetical protein